MIPLCSGVMTLGDYGTVNVQPGDIVGVVAAEVPHSLRSAAGEEGYVVTCWTEGRIMRLIDYAEWLDPPSHSTANQFAAAGNHTLATEPRPSPKRKHLLSV